MDQQVERALILCNFRYYTEGRPCFMTSTACHPEWNCVGTVRRYSNGEVRETIDLPLIGEFTPDQLNNWYRTVNEARSAVYGECKVFPVYKPPANKPVPLWVPQ